MWGQDVIKKTFEYWWNNKLFLEYITFFFSILKFFSWFTVLYNNFGLKKKISMWTRPNVFPFGCLTKEQHNPLNPTLLWGSIDSTFSSNKWTILKLSLRQTFWSLLFSSDLNIWLLFYFCEKDNSNNYNILITLFKENCKQFLLENGPDS